MGLCASGEEQDYETIEPYDGETFLCFRHGEGTYHYSNGDTYKGQWKWNKMHGHGIYTDVNGEVLTGYFYEDEYIGDSPGDLFAVTSCCGKSSAKPLPRKEETRRQEQSDEERQRLEERAKKREKWKKTKEAMENKYKIPSKIIRNIQEPKK